MCDKQVQLAETRETAALQESKAHLATAEALRAELLPLQASTSSLQASLEEKSRECAAFAAELQPLRGLPAQLEQALSRCVELESETAALRADVARLQAAEREVSAQAEELAALRTVKAELEEARALRLGSEEELSALREQLKPLVGLPAALAAAAAAQATAEQKASALAAEAAGLRSQLVEQHRRAQRISAALQVCRMASGCHVFCCASLILFFCLLE